MKKDEIWTNTKIEKATHNRHKTNLRKIRLDLPESLNFPPKPVNFSSVLFFNQFPSDEIHDIDDIIIYPPSILYQFETGVPPEFIYEVNLPSSTFDFITQPPVSLQNPRFFVYTFSSKTDSPIAVSISVNDLSFKHITNDDSPIDFTESLSTFGGKSILSVETGGFVKPFVVIGVWMSEKTISDIIHECAQRNPFSAMNASEICPITKTNITIPAKGKNCNHENTFDAAAFIGRGISTDMWNCPICGCNIPLEELCVDTSTFASPSITTDDEVSIEWNQKITFD